MSWKRLVGVNNNLDFDTRLPGVGKRAVKEKDTNPGSTKFTLICFIYGCVTKAETETERC